MSRRLRWCGALAGLLLSVRPLGAETGAAGWLRYQRISDAAIRGRYDTLAGPIAALGNSPVISAARDELGRGLASMLDRPPTTTDRLSDARIVLGTVETVGRVLPRVTIPPLTQPGAFWVAEPKLGPAASPAIVIVGKDDRGVLYGAFALLRRIAMHEPIEGLNDHQEPAAPVRWTNEWDNLDGSIERGYAGPSIFFERDGVAADLTRAGEYARLLASVGVNGCAVNNVNANPRAIAHDFVPQLARLADAFRPWGVSLAVSIDFSSPMKIGGLDTFDPLDRSRGGVLEGPRRRHLPRDSRFRRLRAEGRFRRAAGAVGVRTHARRCRERRRAGAGAARRRRCSIADSSTTT